MSQSDGVVAILFTDLVGSAEVLDRLGDEAAEDLRQTHFSLLRGAVANTGGREVKSLGDGLMVAFTSPLEALRCAVLMQQAIAAHNRAQPGRILGVRVGVHAGEPVADEDDLHGTAVVVARRLCDQARGGQILASELVAGLVGRRTEFRLRPAGRLKLKGLTEPTPAVTLDWSLDPPPAQARSPGDPENRRLPEPLASPGRPLVGRDRELGRVHEALSVATGGRGRIVFVVGDMGMGKTRLAEEALGLARQQDFLVLVGRTPAAGSGLAYAPLLSAFGTVLRAREPWERDRLAGDLPHLGRLWPELGLPPPAPVGDPELERALLFEAVARLLERLAAEGPLALFVDDLHWADGPSLALLGYLVGGLPELPVVLVGAYRPEGVAESKALRHFVANALRSGLAVEVRLPRLDREEVAALAAGILGDDPPAALLELSARAAGTPLFVEALVRGLIDAGVLIQGPDGWRLVADQSKTLPGGVRDLVVDRLDLLAPDERSTVDLIAHGTQGLPHELLEDTAGLGPDQLMAAIGRLVSAGLLVQEDDGPEVVYRLSHPLISEVAAAEVPAVAGQRLHARLAESVERLRPRDLDRLAYHYSRAGGAADADRALEVLLEAGERAHGLFAHDEAARHCTAALPLIRDRRPEMLADVLERLGESWEPVGETAAAMEVWVEALGECERTADPLGMGRLHRRLAMAARSLGDLDSARRHVAAGVEALRHLPPSEELVDLYHARLEIDSPISGDPDRAQDAVVELSRLAELLATPRAAAEALLAEEALNWGRGKYDLGRAKAEEALRVAEGAGEWLLAQRAHRELAWFGLLMFDHDTTRRHAHFQLEIDGRLGSPANEVIARLQLALPPFFTGDWDDAERLVKEAILHSRRYENRRYLAMGLGLLAQIRILRGDFDGAEECLAEAHQVFPKIPADTRGPRHLVGWPEATLALERGDFSATQEIASELRAPVTQVLVGTAKVLAGDLEGALVTARVLGAQGPPNSYPAALADRIFGLVEQARCGTEAAREHLERSAEALATLGLPFEAAVSRFHLGTVDSVREALATFEALGAVRYADRARRALRGQGVRVPAARSGRDADQRLSRREREVARLVSAGLTNTDIAERLVLSVRTVESHLDHIYGRLGISSRAALASWVTAHDTPASTP